MHRSGTSALGGALESLGLTVGKSVMPPSAAEGNPKGYAENLALMQWHDRFLASFKSIWWEPAPVRASRFSGGNADQFRRELLQLLGDEFGRERPLIKDPRMCRLMPLWLPVINQCFPQAGFILPIRHPVEVAQSLVKRDKLALGLCLKLWVVHVLEGERFTRGFRRLFTSYDELMKSPAETLAGVTAWLGLPARAADDIVSGKIDPALRHHAKTTWPGGEPHEDLTLAIYRTLVSGAAKRDEELDGLRKEYYGRMRWKA